VWARVTSRSGRFFLMMLLTSSFFLVELIVGHITGSLALVADAWHMLSDVLSLGVGFAAVRLAARQVGPASGMTFGWARAEIVGALVNGVFLLALCLTIAIDAMERIASPHGTFQLASHTGTRLSVDPITDSAQVH